MRWPWTSVARLDDAKASLAASHEEVAWLRSRVEALSDQITRIERASRGMSEQAREARRPLEPITRGVYDLIQAHGDARIREKLTRDAKHAHAAGESWAEIERRLKPQQETASG